MVFSFPILQLNCQKRLQSALVVQDITNKLSTFLAFLQEPYECVKTYLKSSVFPKLENEMTEHIAVGWK